MWPCALWHRCLFVGFICAQNAPTFHPCFIPISCIIHKCNIQVSMTLHVISGRAHINAFVARCQPPFAIYLSTDGQLYFTVTHSILIYRFSHRLHFVNKHIDFTKLFIVDLIWTHTPEPTAPQRRVFITINYHEITSIYCKHVHY